MEKTKISNIVLAKNFNEEVTRWRQIAAKIWSLLVIFFMVHAHYVTAKCSLFNISGLFLGFFLQLFSIRYLFYTFIILAIYCALFTFNDKLFRVSPKVFSSNFEKYSYIMNSLHSFCITSKFISALIISSILIRSYDSNENHNYFYVVGFCAFSCFLSELKFSFDENYLLNWPIIEQTKYFRIKSQVYNLILKSFKIVFSHFLIWQIVYFFVSCWFSMLSLTKSGNELPISMGTIVTSIKLGFLLTFANLISWKIYETYLTEIYHFNVQSNIHSQLNLSTAMSLNSHSYIQTLAFIDFVDLSIFSAQKRNQIFSLSLTTNQPVNWIKISTESLNLIKDFMEAFSFDEMVHGKSINDKQLKQSIDTPTRLASFNPRISTLSPLRDQTFDSSYLKSPSSHSKNPIKSNPMSSNLKVLADLFKKQKFLGHLYKENANSKTQSLFIDSFIVLQALKGLSNLAMRSFTEDQYGIVQQTLPDILTILIHLQKLLEKFNPSNNGTSISFRILQNDDANGIDLMIQKLVFILNQSIFKITQTFGASLRSLVLSEEVMKRLKRYYLTQ